MKAMKSSTRQAQQTGLNRALVRRTPATRPHSTSGQAHTLAAADAARDAALRSTHSLGVATAMLHAEASAYALLSAEEERTLGERIQAGDTRDAADALETLVAANTRLVGQLARHYVRRRAGVGAELDDLMQEGMLGLLTAARKFDPARGFRFTTVATWWIRQAIARSLVDRAGAIRVPAYLRQRQQAVQRARLRITASTGEEPTTAALAEATSLTPEQVETVLRLPEDPLSLERPFTADSPVADGQSLADFLLDEGSEDLFAAAEQRADLLRASPDSVLTIILRLRQRQTRRNQFGRNYRREMDIVLRRALSEVTLDELASEMNISRERVRQLEMTGHEVIRAERARVREHLDSMQRNMQRKQQRAQQRKTTKGGVA